MEALPEDLRQAVTLREIEGLSYEEIASAMNCPIGTVRSRIFRARGNLGEDALAGESIWQAVVVLVVSRPRTYFVWLLVV
jgi:DNA-directed RNA polymerase specialized sigma24 family protein